MPAIIKKGTTPKERSNKHKDDQPPLAQGVADTIAIKHIDFSPLNYRKYFRREDLETFAEELKLHGIISPLTVRKKASGRFELVAGERRLRAAQIAKLATVPVVIRELTDEQVTEIQLAENLQRENPHPLDEANAVKLMQDTRKGIDEIALRLGKSKQFVYVRLKLLNLIEPIREMFYADAVTIRQAVEIATISHDGQTEFFNECCTKWKQKSFSLDNLAWQLRKYKYDLKKAPFNVKDKNLLPQAGACSGCQYNSATVKSLFPEQAKQAICTNPVCYMTKCSASLRIAFTEAIQVHTPIALLCNGELSAHMEEVLKAIPKGKELPRYEYHQVTVIAPPQEPNREDYVDDYSEGEPVFDEEDYKAAIQEYEAELAEYEQHRQSGTYQTALVEKNGDFLAVLFSPEPPPESTYGSRDRGLTMKAVQEALKAGAATEAMLDEAIEAILHREERAKEIDRNKVQLAIHSAFEKKIREVSSNSLTKVDLAAARLLIYQSLDFGTRRIVDEVLFSDMDDHESALSHPLYERLASLTDQQYSYLIRMAIACKSDSKYPRDITGATLYKVAGSAGIDVARIEQDQESKASDRGNRMNTRIRELEKKKEKLKA